MPWGVNRFWLPPLLRQWLGAGVQVQLHDLPPLPRGPARLASRMALRVPAVQHFGPSIVELRPGRIPGTAGDGYHGR